jgi:ABC-2 type transport system permease protein
MTASLLTPSMTVAFILGAVFCALPIFLGDSGSVLGGRMRDGLVWMGVTEPFYDFAKGVASLRAVAYFCAMAVLFLYVNLVLLARRHARGEEWAHHLGRAASLLVIGVCVGVLTDRSGCRLDLTAERLFTLTKATKDVVDRIDAGRPVYVTAFVTPEVPTEFVEQRENLLGLLREVDARGGQKVEVRVVDTTKYSAEAREAETYGLKAERVGESEEGAHGFDDIYLGVHFRCGAEQVAIPFVHRGMSVEYELTRSLGTVSGTKRRKVGVATTDAKVFGGLDFQTFQHSPEWMIVAELKKQYEVVQVSLDAAVTEAYDALLVPQASSLTQAQLDNLLAYVKQGRGTLLFDDPFPAFNPGLGPDKPKNQSRGNNPFMPPPPGDPKGDVRKFYDALGVVWNPSAIVWDTYNPHPSFRDLEREIVFVTPQSGNPRSFHAGDPITSGLQEMVFIYSGEISAKQASSLSFTPLLVSAGRGGTVLESELFSPGFFGRMERNPNARYRVRGQELVLAARVQGTLPAEPPPPPPKDGPPPPPPPPPGKVNVLVCMDLDAISDTFFGMRNRAPEGLNFDNVTFVLNAVDVVAGDESYVDLRKRRPKHRTLARVEALTKQYKDRLIEDTKKAEDQADDELKQAQKRLDDVVAEVSRRTDIDENRKAIEIEAVRQKENRSLQTKQQQIEDKKKEAVERARGEHFRSDAAVKKGIKMLAVLLPPVPAVLLAGFIFSRRVASRRKAA